MNIELKPCPFCGSYVVSVFVQNGTTIECQQCGASIFAIDYQNKAEKLWNTRPAEDAKDKVIDRLKAELEELRKSANE